MPKSLYFDVSYVVAVVVLFSCALIFPKEQTGRRVLGWLLIALGCLWTVDQLVGALAGWDHRSAGFAAIAFELLLVARGLIAIALGDRLRIRAARTASTLNDAITLLLVLASIAGIASTAIYYLGSVAPPASLQDWWLNTNYAQHGKSVDNIFYFIFWLTTVIMVVVEIMIVWFMIKYRRRAAEKKAVYSHGNTRLEMIWTLIPAVILIVLALWTKRVWDNYRYSPAANDPNTVKILVIGEQYQWDVVYGGPHNKIGKYLIYPKTTDLNWPADGSGFPEGVPGPAFLPEKEARRELEKYISQANPLGRDFSDPDTNPDVDGDNARLANLNDYHAVARALVLPVNRPVEIQLGSRDVIHDFFLPNFRTRLDVVPGMRGKVYVTAGSDCPAPRAYTLDELQNLLNERKTMVGLVNGTTGGHLHGPPRQKYYRLATKDGETLLLNGDEITSDVIAAARAAGIKTITATIAYDLVCEELCGLGHSGMRGKVIVLDEASLKERPYVDYFPAPVSPAPSAAAKH